MCGVVCGAVVSVAINCSALRGRYWHIRRRSLSSCVINTRRFVEPWRACGWVGVRVGRRECAGMRECGVRVSE